ncbi:polysaccharide pyruvyl transferase family protein [Rubrivivax benzoatilyticus]|uniref:Polysaccharide pyruvyl transferase family protein n=1 Tax=Rubrivivax benzoatilyticus TaxID=316997 RepID=A0ABX0HWM1_9BURK|nr:polysaccharide pyruvyl transferase family protein [Rubrivivax benzoatilyticus]EGJ09795.1 succinoglycan biosynthesis ketolase [Rubrivivax benzoatilyticus JA2 = ATCC BAA-35]MCD0423665.1 polysaccharide pyruvyl transferase family protein [Rubrivivax sp. JA1024]NHK99410.1 polysaccharide pyruvyl transferase family protein [Rubrivivax benzoatilyticus]NHL25284.1 polysaccharide pyruvyl transferase family protein [Rubrivivax benzoatilyticus]
MKLHYFHDPEGNFGDDLNPWLWPRLLPGLLDDDGRELLVGIGTLLNHRLPVGPVKHVFGSGVGYGGLPAYDGRLQFHAVRGFLSADRLGLPADKVITDAAVLLRLVPLPPTSLKRVPVGLMLTGRALRDFDWAPVCGEAGVHLISCHWPVERVLDEIRRCDILLTETMHGAIVADLYRVPWVPVTCSPIVLEFKWQDWLSSLRMDYAPTHVTPLFDASRALPRGGRFKAAVKRGLRTAGLWHEHWAPPPARSSGVRDQARAAAELRAAAQRRPMLSDERLLETHVQRYAALLEAWARGRAASTQASQGSLSLAPVWPS